MRNKKTILYPIRTRFAEDIVAEVLFPERQQGKVAIVCLGAPSLPSKRHMMDFLTTYGYVVIVPRYRGTWESAGDFLDRSPARDIQDVIETLAREKSIQDLFTGEKKPVRVSAIHLFGMSFGGPAVLLNSKNSLVKKIIAISPVIDWKLEGEDEPFDFFVKFTLAGFGGAYRVKHARDWQKLLTTDFYNPIAHTRAINGRKIFILHAQDDQVVPDSAVIPFAEKTGAQFYLKPHGGHRLDIRHQFLWKKIEKFLRQK